MPILVNQSYESWSQSDIDIGECSDSGFVKEDDPCTFRELVAFMKNHPVASSYPASGSVWEWYSAHPDLDFITGEVRNTAIHFSRKNPERMAKYWKLAAKVAGIVK